MRRLSPHDDAAEEDRDGSLGAVAEHGRCREPLVAGAEHVGGADVAGADGADVAEAGEARVRIRPKGIEPSR